MKYPLFEEIFTTKEYTVPATNLSEAREMKTTNFLIRSNGYPYVLDSRVLGGKTGNTSKAGRCLVTLSEKDGMRLISVILGAKAVYGADGYSFARYGNFEETSAMLDFAYGRFTTMQVLHPTQVAGQFAVSGGAHNAFGAISETMSAAVPVGSDINAIRYEYSLTGNLAAPVAKDQEIGVVRVWYENTCLAQQTLRSASAVAVEEKRQESDQEQEDDSEGIWNTILTVVLIAVAVIFVLVMALRIRAAAIRRRRRRRKNAAKAKQKRRS
jgi:D-alanyl-D-alanine carboxypeptidase (penicillin-binding protein 5/6)